MSKNNTNNERNQNNNRGGRNNKTNRQPKVNPNEIKVPLYLPEDLDENISSEITDVLEGTKFNKISIPLGTYRYLIDNTVNENDTRICTIGYIRNYNAETKEFTVIIFSNFIDLIKEFKSSTIEIVFTTYKEALGTITKFNIVPFAECEDCVETNE